MNRSEMDALLSELKKEKIIVIVRGVAGEDLPPLVEALYQGGIRFAEITFDQKDLSTNAATAAAIADLRARFRGKMHIGAGTVMTKKQAVLAIAAGAEFLISPNADLSLIRLASRRVLSLPGAYTPTEIAASYAAGAAAVKVFPADALGPAYFKAVAAPISNVPLLAVGGVTLDNLAAFLAAGAVGVGIGSALTPKALIAAGDFAAITKLAAAYVAAAQGAAPHNG